MEGLKAHAKKTRAFDGEELRLAGTLHFRHFVDSSRDQRCDLHGELNLRGANIGGQFLLEGVKLVATRSFKTAIDQDEETASVGQKPTLALMAEGAVIGGDVFFREDERAPACMCDVSGQVDLAGTRIDGELDFYGEYKSTEQHIRAFRAQRIHIGGDLRFGWLPGVANNTHTCTITGECDFSEATVLGKVIFAGSTHEVSLDLSARKVWTVSESKPSI